MVASWKRFFRFLGFELFFKQIISFAEPPPLPVPRLLDHRQQALRHRPLLPLPHLRHRPPTCSPGKASHKVQAQISCWFDLTYIPLGPSYLLTMFSEPFPISFLVWFSSLQVLLDGTKDWKILPTSCQGRHQGFTVEFFKMQQHRFLRTMSLGTLFIAEKADWPASRWEQMYKCWQFHSQIYNRWQFISHIYNHRQCHSQKWNERFCTTSRGAAFTSELTYSRWTLDLP